MSKKDAHFTYFIPDSAGHLVEPAGAAGAVPVATASASAIHGGDVAEIPPPPEITSTATDGVVRSPTMNSRRPSGLRVRADDGDRCVAHAKSRPKRRQPMIVNNGGGGGDVGQSSSTSMTTTTMNWIRWTDESYDVTTIARMYAEKFPMVVRVTKGGDVLARNLTGKGEGRGNGCGEQVTYCCLRKRMNYYNNFFYNNFRWDLCDRVQY
jgi:hypothetical protein